MSSDARNHNYLPGAKDRAKERERQAEQEFLEYTQWQAEFELMESSHRFLEQFSRNPFAGTRMKEHDPRAVPAADATSGNGNASAIAGGGDIAMASRAFVPCVSERGTVDTESTGVSRSESPVKIITEKAPSKLNPCAKSFSPDPNLIVTPWGILPKNKALAPHLRDRVETYDPAINKGYRAYYGHLMKEFHQNNDGGNSKIPGKDKT